MPAVIITAAALGLIGGVEIGMITLAAVARFKWKKAWLATIAALVTFVPILAIIYLFFKALPGRLPQVVAGIIILLLGAYFFYEGAKKKFGKETESEEEKLIAIGIIGVYAAILIEELEEGSIAMSIGAATGSFLSAVAGMVIGIIIPLLVIRGLKPFVERLPEWAVQIVVGAIMMAAASLIIVQSFMFRFL